MAICIWLSHTDDILIEAHKTHKAAPSIFRKAECVSRQMQPAHRCSGPVMRKHSYLNVHIRTRITSPHTAHPSHKHRWQQQVLACQHTGSEHSTDQHQSSHQRCPEPAISGSVGPMTPNSLSSPIARTTPCRARAAASQLLPLPSHQSNCMPSLNLPHPLMASGRWSWGRWR